MNLPQSYRCLLISAVLASFAHAQEPTWYQAPFRLKAGDKLLDTFEFDGGGHAAPFMADLDGDGRRDLVVGSIAGKFRFFKNVGRDDAPKFGAESSWLMAGLEGDVPAEVPNFCCVASGPQLVDVDRDGILDLTSGSYQPGALFYFKGLGQGRFAARQMLTEGSTLPVFAHPERNVYEPGNSDSFAANLAWADWNADGYLDLIIGDIGGELLVRLNDGGRSDYAPPIKGQPTFVRKTLQSAYHVSEIIVAGQEAIPGGHSAPAVADWDGDGLWDILAGSKTGAVYLLRNNGAPGKPAFTTREELLPPGTGFQLLEANALPGRGIRTQIQAVDYNLDGKMDLLVGEWSVVQTLRPDLTKEERETAKALQAELVALDKLVGNIKEDPGYRKVVYGNSNREDAEALLQRTVGIEERLNKYMQIHRVGADDYPYRCTGYVWVFLRK